MVYFQTWALLSSAPRERVFPQARAVTAAAGWWMAPERRGEGSDVLLERVGVGSGSRKLIAPRCCIQKRSKDNESIFHMLKCVYLGIPEYCTEKGMKGWGRKREKKILSVKYFCDLWKKSTLRSEQNWGGTLREGLMSVIKHLMSCCCRKTGKVTFTTLDLICFILLYHTNMPMTTVLFIKTFKEGVSSASAF